MLSQLFSLATLLSVVGVIGFRLAGKNVWWAWYVNIGCQVLWVIFALAIEQYGLLIGVAFYTWVFGKNAYEWTMNHRDPYRGFDFNEVAMPEPPPFMSLGFHINNSEEGEDGVRVITDANLMGINLVDRPPHPSWTIQSVNEPAPSKPGKHKKDKEDRLDRLIKNDVEHVYRKDRPLDPDDEWAIREVGPAFKHRGEVPGEEALSYTAEELMTEGQRLASRREDLIAQGVDPADLAVPLAPTQPVIMWDCGNRKCPTVRFSSELVDWEGAHHSKTACPTCPTCYHKSWIKSVGEEDYGPGCGSCGSKNRKADCPCPQVPWRGRNGDHIA